MLDTEQMGLRPVGTIEAPDGYSGHTYTGTLAMDEDGMFWVHGIRNAGHAFLIPVSDEHAARYCTSIGTAPELRHDTSRSR